MSVTEKLTTIAENVPKVYEAGKKSEHNEFWDNYNLGGERAFSGQGWNKDIFKPNRNFTVTAYTFFYHNWLGDAYDLAEQLEKLGVAPIFNSNSIKQAFYSAWFTRVPTCDFSNCEGIFDRVFYGATQLVTIDKIILPPEGNITSFNTPFNSCSRLKNITFEGVIDKSVSFSYSPLSVESLKNIASCLKDFSSDDSNHYKNTLTVKNSAFSALEAEGDTAEYNGVACTWAELIDNKKWNLTQAS